MKCQTPSPRSESLAPRRMGNKLCIQHNRGSGTRNIVITEFSHNYNGCKGIICKLRRGNTQNLYLRCKMYVCTLYILMVIVKICFVQARNNSKGQKYVTFDLKLCYLFICVGTYLYVYYK